MLIKEANGVLRELGRTEVICNNLNPSFVKTIPMVYKFEEVQTLVFRVYDVDSFAPGFDNNNTTRLDLTKQVRLRPDAVFYGLKCPAVRTHLCVAWLIG